MPTVYKVLGQSAPTAATSTSLYTVPASTSAIVSTIAIANRSTASTTFRISVRPAGATLANQHYLAYDASIPGNTTTVLTLGITLAATDVLTVYTSAATVTFSAFGTELS